MFLNTGNFLFCYQSLFKLILNCNCIVIFISSSRFFFPITTKKLTFSSSLPQISEARGKQSYYCSDPRWQERSLRASCSNYQLGQSGCSSSSSPKTECTPILRYLARRLWRECYEYWVDIPPQDSLGRKPCQTTSENY
jgi:hypothetical protein